MTLVILAGRLLVAVVLVAAGAAKLADLQSFGATLVGLGLPPSRTLPAIVAGLEIGVGVASLTSAWPRLTDLAVAAATLAFVAATIIAMRRAPGLRCRCFGALSNARFGPHALIRGLALAVVAVTVPLLDRGMDTAAAWSGVPLVILLTSVVAFALAVGQAARSSAVVHQGE